MIEAPAPRVGKMIDVVVVVVIGEFSPGNRLIFRIGWVESLGKGAE